MNSTVSIITICYNNLDDLIRTIKSVDMQLCLPFEHIIIDGSSNQEIKNWHHSIGQAPYRKFVHEKDDGISDAFNKGIRLAKGQLIVLLNSGDCFASENVISHALDIFEANPDISWIHARYTFVRGGERVTLGKPFKKDLIYRGMRSICHQTMFVKSELYQQYGLYDTSLKLAMDFDFLVRIRAEKFMFTDEVYINFAPDGTSAQNILGGLNENSLILKRHIGFSLRHYIWKARILFLASLLKTRLGVLLYKVKIALKLHDK